MHPINYIYSLYTSRILKKYNYIINDILRFITIYHSLECETLLPFASYKNNTPGAFIYQINPTIYLILRNLYVRLG